MKINFFLILLLLLYLLMAACSNVLANAPLKSLTPRFLSSSYPITQIGLSNWKWYIEVAHQDQTWILLLYSEKNSKGIHVLQEWKKAHTKLSPYVRMGTVNVDKELMLCHRLGIRYYPDMLVIDSKWENYQHFRSEITTESIVQFVFGIYENHWMPLTSLSVLKEAIKVAVRNWDESKIEKNKLFVIGRSKLIPMAWKHLAKKYQNSISLFYTSRDQASTSGVVKFLEDKYQFNDRTEAIIFIDPIDRNQFARLEVDDTIQLDEVSYLETLERWIIANECLFLSQLTPVNFIQQLSPYKYCIIIIVNSHQRKIILDQFRRKAEAAQKQWLETSSSNRPLQFFWADDHNGIQLAFTRPIPHGSLLLVDKHTFKFSVASKNITQISTPEILDFIQKTQDTRHSHIEWYSLQVPPNNLRNRYGPLKQLVSQFFENWMWFFAIMIGTSSFLLYRFAP